MVRQQEFPIAPSARSSPPLPLSFCGFLEERRASELPPPRALFAGEEDSVRWFADGGIRFSGGGRRLVEGGIFARLRDFARRERWVRGIFMDWARMRSICRGKAGVFSLVMRRPGC